MILEGKLRGLAALKVTEATVICTNLERCSEKKASGLVKYVGSGVIGKGCTNRVAQHESTRAAEKDEFATAEKGSSNIMISSIKSQREEKIPPCSTSVSSQRRKLHRSSELV